jgi:rfaE bifunctional protein kinase chain/domain
MTLADWVPQLAGKRLLVVGDLCLDEYVVGRAERLSREAAVPVLSFKERFTIPGAAANPALVSAALGAKTTVVGVVGNDEAGDDLVRGLAARGVRLDGVLTDANRTTITKTRVLAEVSLRFPQQLVRIDRQERERLALRTRRELLRQLSANFADTDAVLLSDYKSGVVDESVVAAAVAWSHETGGLVTVDSQGDLRKFRGCTLIRCNQDEAEATLGKPLASEQAIERALNDLQRRLGAKYVVVTRGSAGMSFVDAEGAFASLPATNLQEVYDTTGAGDTVIAVLSLALATGAPLMEAAQLASIAAGIVVQRLGNAAPTPRELLAAIDQVQQHA